MSSHREAPAISKDPVADNTDTYAFVSPDRPDTLTIISNYLPGELPAGGPNFYEFGDDVLYTINIDNDQDADDDYSFQFRFKTVVGNPDTFLYNTGQITSLSDADWNRKQFYSVSLVREDDDDDEGHVLGRNLACPPCNIGPRSTPDYDELAAAAVHDLPGGIRVFAGQREDPFFVDLGSIFDLGALRPLQSHHLIPLPDAPGVNSLRRLSVHTIAIQLPISTVTRHHNIPGDPLDSSAVLGIYASAKRRRVNVTEDEGDRDGTGPWVQVSRLANPLFNEVIVPMARKDLWNALEPNQDKKFLQYVQQPELARLLPFLYPGAFPNLAGLSAPRADLVAILLTGIPGGIVPGFQNFTGNTYADLLRLNVAIKPASSPNPLGLVGGDPAGFPNGRRLQDDIVTIEVRAVAGLTYPLVSPSYTVDAVVPLLTDGLTIANSGVRYLNHFPYVGVPRSGFNVP
jgi:Domain of unknown function (DUF4331)